MPNNYLIPTHPFMSKQMEGCMVILLVYGRLELPSLTKPLVSAASFPLCHSCSYLLSRVRFFVFMFYLTNAATLTLLLIFACV